MARSFISVGGYLLLAAVALKPGESLAQEYHVDRSRDNRVVFISHAPFDDFEGVTDLIDGYVYWEGDGLTEGSDYSNSELYFEVELDDLDTGLRLRNRQMRNNYLETDEYPYATYSAVIQRVERTGDAEYTVHASGSFGIHGVERPVELSCIVNPDRDGYRVRCGFEVILSDYNIERPSLMFLKLSETIRLELDYYVIRVESE